MDDVTIVQLFWDRSEKAIEAVSSKYGRYCHAIARNILTSPEDAEECVNDTYLATWNSIPPKRPSISILWRSPRENRERPGKRRRTFCRRA